MSYVPFSRSNVGKAEDNLIKYGKMLVSTIPRETTDLLVKLCTSYVPTGTTASGKPKQTQQTGILTRVASTQPKMANPDQFVHIFVHQTEWLIKFLEYILENRRGSPLIYNTLLELYLRDEGV